MIYLDNAATTFPKPYSRRKRIGFVYRADFLSKYIIINFLRIINIFSTKKALKPR